MPESEKLHQNQPGENWDSEIAQREMILRNGQKTNEAEMKMKSLWEHYADLAKEKKLMEELLTLEEQNSEAQPETDLAEKDDTVAEASLPMDEVEKITLLEKIKDKARQSKGFNAVMAGVIAVTMLFSTHVRASAPDINSPAARSESMQMYSNIDQIKDQITIPDVLLDNPDLVLHENSDSSATESEPGIKNGYGEKGMWLSENKPGRFAFASASEVAEVCNNDEKEMMNYTADNQVESFADYLANLPEELQPEGFKGLGIVDTEHKLEELSDSDFQEIKQQFGDIMEKASTRIAIANGKYNNAYMALKDADGGAVHDNMDIIKCTTTENNLEVTEFYWSDDDGNEIGSMMVKITPVYDDAGNITSFKGCMQVINADKQKPAVYKNLTVVPANIVNTPIISTEKAEIVEELDDQLTDTAAKESEGPSSDSVKESIGPSGGDPTEEPTGPTEEPKKPSGGHHRGGGTSTKQWGKEGDPHGGPDVTPSDLVDPNSEITKEENDKINKGNQGYVDDNKATPGSASEANGVDENTGFAKSGITAPEATTSEGRLRGGSNQAATASGESRMAGENAYQSSAATERGREVDNSGNNAQAAAQSAAINNSTSNLGGTNAGANAGSTISAAGRDNNSNAAEERAVANGDF